MQQPRPLEPRLLSRAMRLVSGLHLEAEGAAHTFCSQSWETLHLLARPPFLGLLPSGAQVPLSLTHCPLVPTPRSCTQWASMGCKNQLWLTPVT